MALPFLLGGGIAVAATRAVAAYKAIRFVSQRTAEAKKIQLASSYVGRNPGAISGPGFPSNMSAADITKYTRQAMEKRPWQNNFNSPGSPQAAELKKLGNELFKAGQSNRDFLVEEALKSAPKALKEAAALGALGLGTKIGADQVYRGADGDGPYKPKPRPGPRHKDPYEPPKEPEEPDDKEELDDDSNSTSCIDDSGEMPVAKQEQKTEMTMFTPYGTLSSTR
jgi:hypothetical protein